MTTRKTQKSAPLTKNDYESISIDPKCYYKLGYPNESIVSGQELIDAIQVVWCSVEQKWVS